MSSHREAPEISKDPVADSADVYAFVSPNDPDTVTLIATYVPLQEPAGGPNFYEFGDDVLYEIHIDNDGDSHADITYQFRFEATNSIGGTFLYNSGPILTLDSPLWNRRQTFGVSRVEAGRQPVPLGSNLACPPCNIGPLSTPGYAALAGTAVHTIDTDTKVFCGQRADGFYVDLGAVFDLADLRPFQQAHSHYGMTIPALNSPAAGVNALKNLNVHSIALQIPKSRLLASGSDGTDPTDTHSTIGVWTTASRYPASIRGASSAHVAAGPFAQVSRLGNPLVNEALIPIEQKDFWNRQPVYDDSQFAERLLHPELAGLLPLIYPNVFPNLAELNASDAPRNDLLAILHTGLPAGIIPGFQNFTGDTQADLLRLNVAIPPASAPNNLGLLGGDVAGYPNGRRVFDDVFTIELRVIAGATYSLIDSTFTPDAAAQMVSDGLTDSDADLAAKGTEQYLPDFPYLGVPHSGYDVPAA